MKYQHLRSFKTIRFHERTHKWAGRILVGGLALSVVNFVLFTVQLLK